MKSVYIHIPFCKNICFYCDFSKLYYNQKWASKYLDSLSKEVDFYYDNELVNTIYIGGGTPSILNKEELDKLFSITSKFKLYKEYEFTFECNINDITEELLNILIINKVNRLSIGIQSFNNKKLEFLGRNHNKKDIKYKIKLAKKYFDNINVDFMYGIENEKYSQMKKDLNKFIKLDVPHISTYSLIIEDNTLLSNNNVKNISEDIEEKMYKYIVKKLKRKSYNHYEVSNFSKNGYESVHNINYWKNKEFFGFGLGSSGYINNIRYENTKNFNKYINGQYRLNELLLSKKEDMENFVILGLRMLEGISIRDFYIRYNIDIFDVFNFKSAIKKGLIIYENNYLKIAKKNIYIMNEIINEII